MIQNGLPFWSHLRAFGSSPAIFDVRRKTTYTYADLSVALHLGVKQLSSRPKGLAFLTLRPSTDSVLCYLSLLAAGHITYFLHRSQASTLSSELIQRYKPDMVFCDDVRPTWLTAHGYKHGFQLFGHNVLECRATSAQEINPDTALLMSTSGSTGSAKVVRLSRSNLSVNASQNASSLGINAGTRSAIPIPIDYAYGLSVLNSSLAAGASLLLSSRSIMDRGFWSMCRSAGVTNLPLVPTQVQLLREVFPAHFDLKEINTVTVAASAMNEQMQSWLVSNVASEGVKVYSMYGMTEATARISILPAEEFLSHPSSVGRPVPGGMVNLLDTGEIVYRGPNVMLGYAQGRDDLAKPDELMGMLRTGDTGRMDSAGRLFVTGRLNRICKLLGVRVNLTEVESFLAKLGSVAVTGDESAITVFHTNNDEHLVSTSIDTLASHMSFPRSAFVALRVPTIPKTETGKTNYASLPNVRGSVW